MRNLTFTVLGFLLLGTDSVASANPGITDAQRASIEVGVVFTDDEIRIIRAHYQSQVGNGGNGKGNGNYKAIPPGIEKNLARGKPLPPGIAKQVLPDSLDRALPPVKDGYERVIVAGKILLIEIATQVIRDVLTDVVLH